MMRNNKTNFLLIPVGFAASLILSFGIIYAQTPSDNAASVQTFILQLREQAKTLQEQIASLQAQLQAAKKETAEVKRELKLTRALAPGATGQEVRTLQELLKQFPDIYPEGIVTGYFGSLTEAAVKKFQAKNDIDQAGIVGPKTLAKLNEVASGGGCTRSSVRPCFDHVTPGKTVILPTKAGENQIQACLNSKSSSPRGFGQIKTTLSDSERYQYCFEGKSTVHVRWFGGSFAPQPTFACTKAPQFLELGSLDPGWSVSNPAPLMGEGNSQWTYFYRIETMLKSRSGALFAGGYKSSLSGWAPVMGKSTDNGLHWTPIELPDPPPGWGFVYSMVEDQNGVIYAGGTRLWRSADNGTTWTTLPMPYRMMYSEGFADIYRMLITRDNSLLVASFNTNYFPAKVFRSKDEGKTWSEMFSHNGYITAITEANDGSFVFRHYSGGGGGVYRYANGVVTNTFTDLLTINEPTIGLLNASGGALYFVAVDTAIDVDTIEYTEPGHGLLAAYRSLDNGITWTKLGVLPHSWTNQGLIIEGFDGMFYTASHSVCDNKTSVYTSADRGVTWTTAATSPQFGASNDTSSWSSFSVLSLSEAMGKILIGGNTPMIFSTRSFIPAPVPPLFPSSTPPPPAQVIIPSLSPIPSPFIPIITPRPAPSPLLVPTPIATPVSTPIPSPSSAVSVPTPISTPIPTPIPTITTLSPSPQPISGLPAPTGTFANWGISQPPSLGYFSQSISFQYALSSNTAKFRLYHKKPGETSFNNVAEFSDLATIVSPKFGYSGEWTLMKGSSLHAWMITTKNVQMPSYFAVGDHSFYVTAVDLSGKEGLASVIASQRLLSPLTIESPTAAQSPTSLQPTFKWTPVSGWSSGSYNIDVADQSLLQKGASSFVLQKWYLPSSLSSYTYDGSALDPAKKYVVSISGYGSISGMPAISMPSATTVFWVAPPVTATPSPSVSPSSTPTATPVSSPPPSQDPVTVISPNGGECMAGIFPITWSSPLGSEVSNWRLMYSLDNSVWWYVQYLHSYSIRSYNWASGDVVSRSDLNSSQVTMRVQAYGPTFPGGTLLGSDTSNSVFSVRSTCPGGTVPAVPLNLTATPKTYANGVQSIVLNWTDNSSNELGFAAYKKVQGINNKWDNPVLVNGTALEYQGLQSGTTYEFRVRAGNPYGYSPDSNIVTATIGSTTAMHTNTTFALTLESLSDSLNAIQQLLKKLR